MVAVYVNETHSPRARQALRAHLPVTWTPLHDVEVRNAIRLLGGRGHLDQPEVQGLLGHIDEDLRTGRLERSRLGMEAVFERAGDLSARHAPTTLARALDILHVAALMEAGCSMLVTADGRQIALARAEGIPTDDIRSTTSGSTA